MPSSNPSFEADCQMACIAYFDNLVAYAENTQFDAEFMQTIESNPGLTFLVGHGGDKFRADLLSQALKWLNRHPTENAVPYTFFGPLKIAIQNYVRSMQRKG
jgi:hypothetical protein